MKLGNSKGKKWLVAAVAAAIAAVLAVTLGMGKLSLILLKQGDLTDKLDAMLAAARSGDLTECSTRFAGSVDLGEAPSRDAARGKLWYAYLDSIVLEADSDYRIEGDLLALDLRVSSMDLEGLLADVNGMLPEMKKEHIRSADNNPELYNEEGNLKEPILEEILMDAVDRALPNAAMTEREMTVYFVNQRGTWMIQPTESLIALLSGSAE